MILPKLRTRIALIACFVWAGLLIVGGLFLVDLVKIRADLTKGKDELSDLTFADVDARGGIDTIADGAADRFDRAARNAKNSIWFKALAPLPVIGNQVDAVRDMTETASTIGDIARQSSIRIAKALEDTRGDPAKRVALIDTVVTELDTARGQLRKVDLGARGWLVPPLSSIRGDLADRLVEADDELDQGIQRAQVLRSFLFGPRHLLVLAGNNAEMSGVAMPLTAGVATVDNGAISLSDFVSTADLMLPRDQAAPVPGDPAKMYSWLGIGWEWRETLTSPNFPAMAPVYAEMAKRRALGNVDGLIYVDVATLQGLLTVTGPVEVDGVSYAAENAALQLLYENYLAYDTNETAEQQARRDVQGRVAAAAFDALQARDYSLPALAHVLQVAAETRHLMMWSSHPDEQQIWLDLEIAGALDDEGILVSAQNVTANKLDLWIAPAIDLDVRVEGDHRRATLKYTIENVPRERTSDYIEGLGRIVPKGDYRQYLVLYLPHFAHDIYTPEKEGFFHEGNDGPNFTVGLVFVVPKGEKRTVTVEFSLPLAQTLLKVFPSGRLAPMPLKWRGMDLTEAFPLTLPLGGYPFGGP